MGISEERIKRCLEKIASMTPRPETLARDLERARQTAREQASLRPMRRGSIRSVLLRSRIVRIAAVLCIGLLALVALRDRGIEIDGSQAALARVLEAMNRMPVMHETRESSYGGPETHQMETWYDFSSRTAMARCATDSTLVKISSLNYDTMEELVYTPQTGTVRIVYRCDVSPDGYPESPGRVVQNILDLHTSRGVRIVREKSKHGGIDADLYRFMMDQNGRSHREQATLVVDPRTDLPMAMTWKMWSRNGHVTFSYATTFDFPAMGPRDIYEIGAPRSAEVVLDVASKERYERKLALERLIPQLEEEYERSLAKDYQLSDEQVLALVPPALAKPRLDLQQARDEVQTLVVEQIQERAAPVPRADEAQGGGRDLPEDSQPRADYVSFTWDNGLDTKDGRWRFRGSVSLREAAERMAGLSRFEYEIAENLKDVNIPGDWVLRKGSPRELRIAALERTVQESTGRPIVFRKLLVEREVIVARGTFRFQPLSGTYDDSWIHVYADQLEPDERSGGGSGSLERFIRYLGEINFNRQVLDETQGDGDVEVSYGWHQSGYIRLIADEKEKAEKLQMVLDNVSRQTGLTFSIERRTVPIWMIVEDR